MRTLILCLAFMAFSGAAFAQTKKDIVGSWRVEEANFPPLPDNMPKANQDQMKAIKSAMKQAVFTFKADGSCTLSMPHPAFNFENVKWVYDPQTRQIKIYENQDPPGSLMRIFISQEGDWNTYFIIDETDIRLKVKRG